MQQGRHYVKSTPEHGCFRVLEWRRQEGQQTGSLLKLTRSKTRYRSYNKNRMKRMKCGPHSLQPTKGTSQNWITKGGEGY